MYANGGELDMYAAVVISQRLREGEGERFRTAAAREYRAAHTGFRLHWPSLRLRRQRTAAGPTVRLGAREPVA